MEVPPLEGEPDLLPGGKVGVADELSRKIEELEKKISVCCEEEEYEAAGEWAE